MDFILGFVIGSLVLAVYYLFSKKSFFKSKAEEQSVILLEKMKSVSKLITVEGSMNEIMHFHDTKTSMLKMVSSKKKAIIMANAKVFIGFNMKEIAFEANIDKCQIKVTSFPEPEIIGLEIATEFYDIQNGLFNKFDATELTDLNKKVKQNFKDKIPETDLFQNAQLKALDSLKIMEQMLGTFGWKLKYDKVHTIEKSENNNFVEKLLS